MSETKAGATKAADFTPHIGQGFLAEGAEAALTLIKMEPQAVGFILIFQGPARPVLPEGMYEFAVEDGSTSMFHIMPIHTPLPGHQDYQAVFN